MVEIEINVDDLLEYAERRLGQLSKKAKPVVKRAINNTAKEISKRTVKQAKKVYTAKKDIGSASDFKTTKATTSKLQAILRSKGSNVPINRFSFYSGKKQLTAKISTLNGRKPIAKYGNKAFLAMGMGSAGNNPIMVRVSGRYMSDTGNRNSSKPSKHTEALEKVMSISRPVMLGNSNTWGKIEAEMGKKLLENVNKEIDKELRKL